jgi:hypothetical protein
VREYEDEDEYFDDPDTSKPRKLKFGSKFLSLVVFATIAILGSTFATNINLNSGSPVEFGQGMARLVSCAEGNSITLVPKASFVNASNNGSFYFTEALFSNIPSNCKNTDFYLNAFGVTGSALRLAGETCSNGDGTLAVIRFMGDETTRESPLHPSNQNNAYLKISNTTSDGFSVSWAEGGCSPAALARDVHKITLQTKQELKDTAFYDVGDVSPSGGLIFFKKVNSPTSHTYFEVAPRSWNGTDEDPATPWCVPYGVAQKTLPHDQEGLVLPNVTTTDSVLGSGFSNTSKMIAWCKSGAAQLVKSYDGGGFFDWHLPSKIELTQLCKFTHGDFASDLTTACASGGQLLTGQFAFTSTYHWSSTSNCDSGNCFSNVSGLGTNISIQDGSGVNTRYAPKYELQNSDGYQLSRVRPIRSWTVNIE